MVSGHLLFQDLSHWGHEHLTFSILTGQNRATFDWPLALGGGWFGLVFLQSILIFMFFKGKVLWERGFIPFLKLSGGSCFFSGSGQRDFLSTESAFPLAWAEGFMPLT